MSRKIKGPPAPPAISEELPLLPEYRAVLDEFIARAQQWDPVGLIGTIILAPLIGSSLAFISRLNGWWLTLLMAAIIGGLNYYRIRGYRASLRQRQTYLRSTGALWVSEESLEGEGYKYTLYVGQRPFALPEGADTWRLGLPIYDGTDRVDDGQGGLFPGSVDHSEDNRTVFAIADAAGRTLYRHPLVSTRP